MCACDAAPVPPTVVIIGGGPAGLSAAIEASSEASVVLLERNTQLGGSARYAAGITAVPGPKGPGILPVRYARGVESEVLSWTESLGQSWEPAPNPLPDGLLLRRPVGGGPALIAVLESEARRRGVSIRLSAEVSSLEPGPRWQLGLDGGERLKADAVIVATGGFAGQLQRVRAALGVEHDLLRGAPLGADGNGADLIVAAGGQLTQPQAVLLYGHGVPSPDDPQRALMIVEAPGAVWMESSGAELSPRTVRGAGGDLGSTGKGWLVVDQVGLAGLMLTDPFGQGSVDASAVVAQSGWGAANKAELEGRTGSALGRLGPCPCAALPIRPTSSKSLSGVRTSSLGLVLSQSGTPIPGLFAAGEAAGFGSADHPPVDSTMIAGAIMSGRRAGRAAARAR